MFFFFFFQAEDGIRDKLVTGVQTCALPISRYQTPNSWLSMYASVASTTPSPFRSPPAPPYQTWSWAGSPNSNPVGSSEILMLVGSIVAVTSTESPVARSPRPGTHAGSVMVRPRNGAVVSPVELR